MNVGPAFRQEHVTTDVAKYSKYVRCVCDVLINKHAMYVYDIGDGR